MIQYRRGNILASSCEALVNTVNCVGVMGKGVALSFKKTFPKMFVDYQYRCRRGLVKTGLMDIHVDESEDRKVWIINFPTKQHWRNPSQLPWILGGLVDLRRAVMSIGIQSIAIPPLGCGNGGLNWKDVRPLIEAAFKDMPNVKVEIYEPAKSY
jgi:O-acetyl-ADP-ribose deacetylase (regulator of RNase III)